MCLKKHNNVLNEFNYGKITQERFVNQVYKIINQLETLADTANISEPAQKAEDKDEKKKQSEKSAKLAYVFAKCYHSLIMNGVVSTTQIVPGQEDTEKALGEIIDLQLKLN